MNQKLIFSKTKFWFTVDHIVSWIFSSFQLGKTCSKKDFEYLISHLQEVSNSRGPLESFRQAKLLRVALLNYLSGSKVRLDGIKYTYDGLPYRLGPLNALIRKNDSPIEILRIINTILYSPRSLKLGKDPDITPITAPPLGSIANIGMFAGSFWRDLGYVHREELPNALLWNSFHFTTKAGPCGHALGSSMEELLYGLPDRLISSIKVLGGKRISEVIDNLKQAVPLHTFLYSKLTIVWKGEGIFRRLSYFPDKEEKVRVIAVLDYWSQTVLRPLHSYLYRALRKIPQDCTFNQGSFKDKLKSAEIFYSVDLTAATDRFPIDLISQILKAHLPTSYVDAWKDIMVGYPFLFTRKGAEGKDIHERVNYAAGNPMGAYSSWASFALTHHYLIYYSCKVLGKNWKELPYALLGDDIVIGDREVGDFYLKLLKTLGVEFSPVKTHISSTLYEFAKRLIYKGQEITPFPISAIREAKKDNSLFVNLLLEGEAKGWVTKDGIPCAMGDFAGRLKSYNSKLRKRLMDACQITELMIKTMSDISRAEELFNQFLRDRGYRLPHLKQSVCVSIISNLIVDCFSESYEGMRNVKRGIGLGQLCVDIVMFLTGSEHPLALMWLENPICRTYGQIEELYVNLMKDAKNLDMTSGDWSAMSKVIVVPLDDRVFSMRTSHTKVKASAIIGKKLLERFDIIQAYPSLLPNE